MYLTDRLTTQVLVAEVIAAIVPSWTTTEVACLATGTHLAVLIKALAKVPVIENLDCAVLLADARSAQISVVAPLDTVANFKFVAVAEVAVVTNQIIEINSQTPTTLNNVPVAVAGKVKFDVIAICSSIRPCAAKVSITPLVPAAPNSVSVGAVV